MKPNPDASSLPDDPRLLLSRLMDGDADPDLATRVCAAWRDDPSLRREWHGYHLIGDVLRSDDLAGKPGRDAAFLAALRGRLAAEPPIVAPAPVATPVATAAAVSRGRHGWLAPAAIAAGFMAVAGVLVVSRMSAPEATGPVLASSGELPQGLQRAGVGASAGRPATGTFDAQLIRDAQIDAYLRAHREARGSSAMAVPGGVMRSVDTIVPQR